MEKLSSTEKRRKSDAFDMIKEAIGRVYETICCSLVNQRCACSSISRGTIRKLRGGKIKGNQPSVPTPSFDLSRLSFSSTSCMPSLSLPCLLLALDLDPRRRWRRHVDWRDFYAVFGGEGGGICHPSGLKHVKNVKNMKIFNPVQKFRKESFFWILVVDENYWRCFLEIAYFWELKIFRSSIFCYTN